MAGGDSCRLVEYGSGASAVRFSDLVGPPPSERTSWSTSSSSRWRQEIKLNLVENKAAATAVAAAKRAINNV